MRGQIVFPLKGWERVVIYGGAALIVVLFLGVELCSRI
jgi:hypothetical protein